MPVIDKDCPAKPVRCRCGYPLGFVIGKRLHVGGTYLKGDKGPVTLSCPCCHEDTTWTPPRVAAKTPAG